MLLVGLAHWCTHRRLLRLYCVCIPMDLQDRPVSLPLAHVSESVNDLSITCVADLPLVFRSTIENAADASAMQAHETPVDPKACLSAKLSSAVLKRVHTCLKTYLHVRALLGPDYIRTVRGRKNKMDAGADIALRFKKHVVAHNEVVRIANTGRFLKRNGHLQTEDTFDDQALLREMEFAHPTHLFLEIDRAYAWLGKHSIAQIALVCPEAWARLTQMSPHECVAMQGVDQLVPDTGSEADDDEECVIVEESTDDEAVDAIHTLVVQSRVESADGGELHQHETNSRKRARVRMQPSASESKSRRAPDQATPSRRGGYMFGTCIAPAEYDALVWMSADDVVARIGILPSCESFEPTSGFPQDAEGPLQATLVSCELLKRRVPADTGTLDFVRTINTGLAPQGMRAAGITKVQPVGGRNGLLTVCAMCGVHDLQARKSVRTNRCETCIKVITSNVIVLRKPASSLLTTETTHTYALLYACQSCSPKRCLRDLSYFYYKPHAIREGLRLLTHCKAHEKSEVLCAVGAAKS